MAPLPLSCPRRSSSSSPSTEASPSLARQRSGRECSNLLDGRRYGQFDLLPPHNVGALPLPPQRRQFHHFFDLLVKLETSTLPEPFRQFGLWNQYNGNDVSRLPVLSDKDSMYILAARPPTPDDHDDGDVCPFPLKEIFEMRCAGGVHSNIKLFSESKGSGHPGITVAERVAELGLYCTVCGKQEGFMKCSGCKKEYYYRSEHQTTDWATHAKW